MSRMSSSFAYILLGFALFVASSPAWRLLFGNNPTVEQLLKLRCSGF